MGKCSHKVNFWAMKMGLVPKCSEEHSAVRDQESGIRGQGSGVKTEVTNWSNIEYKVKMTSNLDI